MSAQRKSALATKAVIGAGLLALGTVLLLGKLALAFSDASTELGAFPAIGMVLLKASTTLPFGRHGVFGVVVGVLVSCWPLLLIVAGTAVLIWSQVERNRASAARG